MEELEIEIGPSGKVTVRTKGIKGARCVEVAESIVQLLGREESRQLTSEFYETEIEVRQRQDLKQRR